MAVHEKIKLIRHLKGWSQEDVAEKLDMSVNGYGSIERGETNVSLARLEQIAELFGIELSELIALNEKNMLYMSGAYSTGRQQNQYNCVVNANESNSQHSHELEKLQLIIEWKDNQILMKDQEILNLKKIISLLETVNKVE